MLSRMYLVTNQHQMGCKGLYFVIQLCLCDMISWLNSDQLSSLKRLGPESYRSLASFNISRTMPREHSKLIINPNNTQFLLSEEWFWFYLFTSLITNQERIMLSTPISKPINSQLTTPRTIRQLIRKKESYASNLQHTHSQADPNYLSLKPMITLFMLCNFERECNSLLSTQPCFCTPHRRDSTWFGEKIDGVRRRRHSQRFCGSWGMAFFALLEQRVLLLGRPPQLALVRPPQLALVRLPHTSMDALSRRGTSWPFHRGEPPANLNPDKQSISHQVPIPQAHQRFRSPSR